MFRHRPETIAALTLAAALGLGCLYDVEGDDPVERTRRYRRAAERGIVRRGRSRTWFLVKYRLPAGLSACGRQHAQAGRHGRASEVPAPADRQATLKAFGGMRLEAHDIPAEADSPPDSTRDSPNDPPPDSTYSAILLKEGQSGFVAVRRGGPVSAFSLAGGSYGGAGVTADRGYDVTVRLSEPGVRALADAEIRLTLTPVFRGLAEGGGDLRLEELTFELTLPPGRALVICFSGPDGHPSPRLPAYVAEATSAEYARATSVASAEGVGPLARAFLEGISADAPDPRAVIVEVEPFR